MDAPPAIFKPVGRAGFTLVELSIVLVIIGLIIGGVLVGRDLIAAAAIRSQISQIEKYQTAVNTFRSKYGYLPGDIPSSIVSQFGFTVVPTRAGTQARGDGNGILEGYGYTGSTVSCCNSNGENAWFWADLANNSGLIDGSFTTDRDAAYSSNPAPSAVLPAAKIGANNYLSVGSFNNINYFSISAPVAVSVNGYLYDNGNPPGIKVVQSYNIDSKIDDGMPQSGGVLARFIDTSIAAGTFVWAAAGGIEGANSGSPTYGPTTNSTAPSATTCYDNNSTTGPQQYSM